MDLMQSNREPRKILFSEITSKNFFSVLCAGTFYNVKVFSVIDQHLTLQTEMPFVHNVCTDLNS